METSELVRRLNESIDILNSGPEGAFDRKAKEPVLSEGDGEPIELFDYLRVCAKYDVLDLEATRRENSYLRKLLKESTKED